MRAFVVRRSQTYVIRYKDGRKDVKQQSFGSGPDARERAEAWAAEFNEQEEAAERESARQGPLTVDQVLEDYWNDTVLRRSWGYQKNAKSKIFGHLIPHFAGIDVRSLRKADVAEYIRAQFLKTDEEGERQPRGYGSVRTELGLLRAAVRRCVESGYLDHDPVGDAMVLVQQQARACRVTEKIRPAWDEKQLATVLAVAGERHRDVYPVCYTGAMTGARVGELLALRWANVDWSSGRAHICETMSNGRLGPPKWGKSRWIQLPDHLLDFLRQHRSGQKRRFRRRQVERVFSSPTGLIWVDSNFHRAWRKCYPQLREARIPVYGFHSFRHTFASLTLLNGEDPVWVANQLGHSLQMLLKRYAHLIQGRRDLSYLDLRPAEAGSASSRRDRRGRLSSSRRARTSRENTGALRAVSSRPST